MQDFTIMAAVDIINQKLRKKDKHNMAKVIVGMSGGVDSAVAAYLLKQQGYEVIGVTLRTWQNEDGSDSRCCEIDDAAHTASVIGIKYHSHNCTSLFKNKVVCPFVSDYLSGLTPNPCIECNRYVKWDKLTELMNVFGADFVATGHYAHIIKLPNGRYTVKTAEHKFKDQTYMLYKLSQEQLSHTLMPLGAYTKDEVRQIAKKAGLPCADKADSQEICFVTEGKYPDFIASHSYSPIPEEGNFIDTEGRILGRHKGIHHYTVGQRKGLGIALGFPAFVIKINPDDNTVVLGPDIALMKDSFLCRDINFLSIEGLEEGQKLDCLIKTRYHQPLMPGFVTKDSGDNLKVVLNTPVKGVCPGQSAVFYDENGYVIGGGKII